MIKDNQRRMINSLLEKPFKKVVIDRLLIDKEGDRELYNEPEEVLKRTAEHFKRQFKKRNFQQEGISNEWKEVYEPITRVKESYYQSLSDRVTEKEWDAMLKKLKTGTAPGISGIGYILIKQASAKTQVAFRNFASRCLETGKIPLKWKVGQTYPIPKDVDWQFNLSNIRPIALLETFRKCVTKVYTTRLERIIRVNNILEGSNFAGLIGSSTESPIHILSMIIEEAKEKNKELWIMLQDMKKAFDSVSLDSLKLALQRIKIPVLGQSFILDLFDKRQTRIITALGLTEAITAGDGIEQGEVISPLIWRIFYDPLLIKIKKSARLGYEKKSLGEKILPKKEEGHKK